MTRKGGFGNGEKQAGRPSPDAPQIHSAHWRLDYIFPTTSISTLVTFSAFSLKIVTISSQETGGSSVFQQS